MIPVVILGAAATAAAASYLIPLIITCIASGVTIIITFVSTRAYYKSEEKNDIEMQSLRKEQAERDAAIHEEVSRVAKETGIDIQKLVSLSKEQQQELKRAINEFVQNIEDSDKATKSLTTIASSIQALSKTTNMQSTELHAELAQIKKELQTVYSKLHDTEQALAKKEQELHTTLERLFAIEQILAATDISESIKNLNQVQETYAKLPQTLNAKNTELQTLQQKNSALCNTISSLKGSIKSLQTKLQTYTSNDHAQRQEIQKLIQENTKLTKTIESLAETMHSQSTHTTSLVTNTASQLRMFK